MKNITTYVRTIGATVVAFALPFIASAQVRVGDFDSAINALQSFITRLIPIVIGLAVLFFLFALLKYITAKDEDSQKEARSLIINGVIVLFVMVSVWGLVNILRGTLGLDTTNIPQAPGIPTTGVRNR